MKLARSIKTKIMKDALARAKKSRIDKKANLHIREEVLAAGEKLVAAALEVPIKRATAFVFVDLAPECNWTHPCEYQLYDAETGMLYQQVTASLPPSNFMLNWQAIAPFHAPVKMIDTRKRRVAWKKRFPPFTNRPVRAAGARYAILFAGHANNRHTNDLEFLYRTLIDDYGFPSGNIHVLNHDGTLNYFGGPKPIGNWPGNNTAYRMNIAGQGTRTGFQAALSDIAGRIGPDDMLFIHANNHGGGPCDGFNDYCMFEYDANAAWIPYYVNDFIADLGILPPFRTLMVMMEQCRSGGFIDPIMNNSPAGCTHVATAVTENDYSLGGADFDPFAEDWIAGIHGQYPDGTGLAQAADTDNDGRISAAEAFHYADAVHQYSGFIERHCPEPNGTPLRDGDTPTSSDAPSGCGQNIFLSGNQRDRFHVAVAIDPLALLLRGDIYVRLHLPDPAPIDVIRRQVRAVTKGIRGEERKKILARAKTLGVYAAAIAEELK